VRGRDIRLLQRGRGFVRASGGSAVDLGVFCMTEEALDIFLNSAGWSVGGNHAVSLVKGGANDSIDMGTTATPVSVINNAHRCHGGRSARWHKSYEAQPATCGLPGARAALKCVFVSRWTSSLQGPESRAVAAAFPISPTPGAAVRVPKNMRCSVIRSDTYQGHTFSVHRGSRPAITRAKSCGSRRGVLLSTELENEQDHQHAQRGAEQNRCEYEPLIWGHQIPPSGCFLMVGKRCVARGGSRGKQCSLAHTPGYFRAS